MSKSKRAVVTFLILMPGVVAGWAAWQIGFDSMEEFLVQRGSGPTAALALWALLGVMLIGGYLAALKFGTRFVLREKPGDLKTLHCN